MAGRSSDPAEHEGVLGNCTQKKRDEDEEAYATQYYTDHKEYWDEHYALDGEDEPPTGGASGTKDTKTKPAPDPAPTNNLK